MMLPYDQLAAIRLGYGLSPRQGGPTTPSAVAASVSTAGPDPDGVTLARIRDWQIRGKQLSDAARSGDPQAQEADRAHRRRMRGLVATDTLKRFARAVDDPGGFGERLAWFCADHFTVSGGLVYHSLMAAALVEDAIRPHLAGRLADMMFAAQTHPAMLRYLNQMRSVGPNPVAATRHAVPAGRPSENPAREMIELHSLSVGAAYTQEDIEQLAALLTGLAYNPGQPGTFRPARAEPGPETVLGRRYGRDSPRGDLADIRAVIDDLAVHEASARHVAHKMAAHFVSDAPP